MPAPTPVQPPVPPAKTDMPVLGWVGIGCGTLILIAGVVMFLLVSYCKHKVGEFTKNPEKATAELIVKMNPNLTLVSQDDAKGEMTIRTKDGEEMTMSYKDIAKGKFTMRDAKGNVTQLGDADLSKLPAWVPRVPKMKSASASFQNQEMGKMSGLYNATSSESLDALEAFFKAEAAKQQMSASPLTTTTTDGVETRILIYQGQGHQLNITISGKPGENVQVNVGYKETK